MDSSRYFWCYRCIRFVRDIGACPECDSGFVEEIEIPSPSTHTISQVLKFISDTMNMLSDNTNFRFPRRNRDHPRFNLVIVIRESDGVSGEDRSADSYDAYFDNGSGLQPCSTDMHDYSIESGYNRLLTQFPRTGRCNDQCKQQKRASKEVVESMPVIEISDCHVSSESVCAVCNEVFELGTEAREMPCKHIYHADCILPWLSSRNSCPVCRYELPNDMMDDGGFNTPAGAPRILICRPITDGRGSSSRIIQVFRNIASFFSGGWSDSSNNDMWGELVDCSGLHWHTLS